MTLTHTQNTKAVKSGMTLIELTVVILVLLSLISILFVGARAWKKGSDRAGCIMNIRNVQQAVRSYQNMYNHDVGDLVAAGDLFGADKFLEVTPDCPDPAGGYTLSAAITPVGALFMTCDLAAAPDNHAPASFGDW